MFSDIAKRIGILLLFAILQALVFGRIHLFGYATPLLYIYFVISYPRNMARWLGIVMAFVLGILVGMFSNLPGVASAALVLIAFIHPYVLELFLDRESNEDFVPSIKTLGWLKYCTFSFFIILVYCLVFFTLEAFTFYNFGQWILTVSSSFILTCMIILVVDSVRR